MDSQGIFSLIFSGSGTICVIGLVILVILFIVAKIKKK